MHERLVRESLFEAIRIGKVNIRKFWGKGTLGSQKSRWKAPEVGTSLCGWNGMSEEKMKLKM